MIIVAIGVFIGVNRVREILWSFQVEETNLGYNIIAIVIVLVIIILLIVFINNPILRAILASVLVVGGLMAKS